MERMFATRPRSLSRAAQETLAIIAYRQPVTRADIEFIRGVDAGSIIKNLLERDLIRCVGRREISGRPMLFGTTDEFLRVYQLAKLTDLPPLASFQPSYDTQEALASLNIDDEVDIDAFVSDRSVEI
jgi:segregation and condensation protein B